MYSLRHTWVVSSCRSAHSSVTVAQKRWTNIRNHFAQEKNVMGIHFANSHGGCWFLHEGGIGYQKKVGITVSCSAQKYTIALIFSWNGCLFCDDICLNCSLNKRKNYNRWRMLFSLVTLLSNTWTSACLYWESRKNKELLGQLPKSKLIHSTLPQQPLIPTKTLLIFKQTIRPLHLEIICKNFEYCY